MVVILLVLIILFFVISRLLDFKTLTIPVLNGIFWIFISFLSYVFMFQDYKFSGIGILWIFTSLFAFILFYFIGMNIYKLEPKINAQDSLSNSCWLFIIALIALGIIKWGIDIKTYGFNFGDFQSLDSLAKVNNEVAIQRYSGGTSSGTLSQILSIAMYSAPLCGGFVYLFAKNKRQKFISILTLLPELLSLFLNNTKAPLIGTLILWLSAYLISYYYVKKRVPYVNVKILIIIILAFILFTILMMFTMVLRIGDVSYHTLTVVFKKYIIYAFGEIQSFDYWLTNVYSFSPSIGKYTYFGIFNVLGLAKRMQGVYTAYLGTSSNVYTVFRGIIQDFGVVLGIIYFCVKGIVSGICFNKLLCNSRISIFSIVYLTGTFFFLIYGYIISCWTYITFIIPFVVFALFLWVIDATSIDKELTVNE